MTTDEIAKVLKLRGCEIVEADGAFALVHPHGYESGTRSHDLLATNREAATREAWLWIHPEAKTNVSIAAIQRIVAADFGLHVNSMTNRERHEPVATARRIAMALARELTLSSVVNIGDWFARDHTTVIWARDSVRNQCATERAFAARVGALRVMCSAALAPDGEEK